MSNKDNVVDLNNTNIDTEASTQVHNVPFTQISNEFIRSPSLPAETRMLLVYLLSFAPGWKFHDSVIRDDMGVGRDKLERMFRELRQAGYVKNICIRNSQGMVVGSKRIFSRVQEFLKAEKTTSIGGFSPESQNEPVVNHRSPENQGSGEPNRSPEKPGPQNPGLFKKNKDLFKKNNKKINKKDFDSEFDQFWTLSQNFQKKKRKSAFERFNELLNKDYSYFERIMTAWKAQTDEWDAKKTPMAYRTFPTYWLRDEGFNDEYLTEEQISEENRRSQPVFSKQPSKQERAASIIQQLRREAAAEIESAKAGISIFERNGGGNF